MTTVADLVRPVTGFLLDHPGVLPALVVLLVVAASAGGALSRRLGCSPAAAALLLFACAAPLGMTLLPSAGLDPSWVPGCITGLRPPQDWGRGGQEIANLLMLLPAGALLVLLLRRRAALVALAVAAALPFAVEATQYLAVGLRRQCEVTDAVLNLAGLAVGAVLGLLLAASRGRRLSRARRAPGPRRTASPGT